MRRRLLLLLAAVLLLVVLALPAVAGAGGTWAVRNSRGAQVGKIVAGPLDWIYRNGGVKVGDVERESASATSGLVIKGKTALGYALVRKFETMGPVFKVVGRALHKNGRWILEKKVNGAWVKRGSTDDSCLPCLALAGLRLLLWR